MPCDGPEGTVLRYSVSVPSWGSQLRQSGMGARVGTAQGWTRGISRGVHPELPRLPSPSCMAEPAVRVLPGPGAAPCALCGGDRSCSCLVPARTVMALHLGAMCLAERCPYPFLDGLHLGLWAGWAWLCGGVGSLQVLQGVGAAQVFWGEVSAVGTAQGSWGSLLWALPRAPGVSVHVMGAPRCTSTQTSASGRQLSGQMPGIIP